MANELTWIANQDNDFFYEIATVGSGTTLCYVGNVSGNTAKGALRFRAINIAQGTTVNYASLFLYQGTSSSNSGNLKFKTYGIDEDNTADFSSVNPFGRSHTTAVDTADNPVPTLGNYKQITVTSIVNEILARGGWSSGNAMGFLMEDNSTGSGIYVLDGNAGINSFLAIREDAEPNFKPTPKSVSAPTFPATQNYGIKMSKPGESVLEAVEADLYYTSRRKQFKVHTEAQELLSGVATKTIAHGLAYTPFVEVFAKESGGDWIRLPWLGSISGDVPYYYVNGTNLVVNLPANGYTIYYYIFLDQLA